MGGVNGKENEVEYRCHRLGCNKECDSTGEGACRAHDSFAIIGSTLGQPTFLFYWCCGAVDRHAKGCIRRPQHSAVDPFLVPDPFAILADHNKILPPAKKPLGPGISQRRKTAKLAPIPASAHPPTTFTAARPSQGSVIFEDMKDIMDAETELPPILSTKGSWVDTRAAGADADIPFWDGDVTKSTHL